MPIRVLDAATVGRIAAGEVVERPSSVVKELVENSLDAGATSITAEIRGGGIDYLRVTDNGGGIEAGQLRLAFENHATSKIQTADQLDDIRTLGFRGEALPSIAAVARVEMTTRTRTADNGARLTVGDCGKINVQEAGCPQGTTIVVRDLFYNVPVRRAFLKKPAYEGGLVSDAVTRLMLGNPGVSMRFISGGNTLFHSFGDNQLRHAVFAAYGRETAEKMTEMDAAEGGTRIYGMIGVGELAKATRAHQMFFINGRSVRCPLLSRALEQVCRSRVTIGLYPMCVLNLILPPTGVDVNVHPNKLEVRFRDEDAMRVTAEKLLESAFAGERVLQIARETAPKPVVEPVKQLREIPLPKAVEEAPQAPAAPMPADVQPPRMPPLPGRQTQLDMRLGETAVLRETPHMPTLSGEAKKVDIPPYDRREVAKAEPPRNEAEPIPSAEKPVAIPYRVIGVVFKTYILVEANDTLLLIDQHAAHERLQYERYMARAQAGEASQMLLAPLVIRLSGKEMAIINDNLSTLADAGYTVEPFGENDIQLRAVPFVLGKAECKPLFLDMLQTLSKLKNATVDMRRSEIMQMACKSAVKGGEPLADSEISALIETMMETGAPPTCPHGRPVVKTITRRELEKMFKRIQ